ncbi:TRAP transporter small permease [Rhizobium sp. AG855]|uniref:TRAP transporter small permease n=1 Tax=Rhizobium sp. AG855 TaxID=2183898 RepID=UPI000E757738|nr:TRAP transporter small permease [Rhizobium sp. AG855]RKE79310.1 TRAP-type C4-dicarboxylate transport system permease small subunit [Rhizobium sp. AG855]
MTGSLDHSNAPVQNGEAFQPLSSGKPGAIDTLARLTTAVSGVALAALAALVTADVMMRYLLGEPVAFVHDFVSLYLTPALFFFGFGATLWRREHLAIDLLTGTLPTRLQKLLELFAAVIGLFVFGLLAWASAVRTANSFAANETLNTLIAWPVWASVAIVPIGTGFMVFFCIASFFRCLPDVLKTRKTTAEVSK